ncbi:MAG: hypothetical protein ACODAU_00775 [Myxococcota bacterium]
MKIETDAVVPFPRPDAFRAYRDELPELVDYLPNVKSIEVEGREEKDGVVELVNVWHAGGDIPAPVRRFVGDNMLSWHDYATWDQAAWTCRWRIETHSFREAVQCSGENRFVELDGGRTRLEIKGELHIDLKKVRGVPAMLAGSLGRTVEQFLVKQITANLSDVSDGLTRYLGERG